MASDLAMQRVAAAWTTEETRETEMDVVLATAMADILDEYIDALRWCGGSNDFSPEGKAHVGWMKIAKPLIDA